MCGLLGTFSRLGDSVRRSIEAYTNQFVCFENFLFLLRYIRCLQHGLQGVEGQSWSIEKTYKPENSADTRYEEVHEWYKDPSKAMPNQDEAQRATEHLGPDDTI